MTDICSTCSAGRPKQVPWSARPSSVESRRRPRGRQRSGGSCFCVLLLRLAGGGERAAACCFARRHAALLLEAGLCDPVGPRPVAASAMRSCWRSGMRNTCASATERCCAGRRKRHAETASSLSYFFADWAVRQNSRESSEAVGRRPLGRSEEDESRSLLASVFTGR